MADTGIKIQIDYREKDFYETFKKAGLPTGCVLEEPVNLDIGDIIINVCSADGVKQQIIIERKRFDDLASSIKDGRYDEQKMRCMSYISRERDAGCDCMLMYLLEGDLSYCRNSNDANMALGAWISMEVRGRSISRKRLKDYVNVGITSPIVRNADCEVSGPNSIACSWLCNRRIKVKASDSIRSISPQKRIKRVIVLSGHHVFEHVDAELQTRARCVVNHKSRTSNIPISRSHSSKVSECNEGSACCGVSDDIASSIRVCIIWPLQRS